MLPPEGRGHPNASLPSRSGKQQPPFLLTPSGLYSTMRRVSACLMLLQWQRRDGDKQLATGAAQALLASAVDRAAASSRPSCSGPAVFTPPRGASLLGLHCCRCVTAASSSCPSCSRPAVFTPPQGASLLGLHCRCCAVTAVSSSRPSCSWAAILAHKNCASVHCCISVKALQPGLHMSSSCELADKRRLGCDKRRES